MCFTFWCLRNGPNASPSGAYPLRRRVGELEGEQVGDLEDERTLKTRRVGDLEGERDGRGPRGSSRANLSRPRDMGIGDLSLRRGVRVALSLNRWAILSVPPILGQ